MSDFDRPLNKRGEEDAPLMAGVLKQRQVSPDLILSSPANRAKATAKIVAKELAYAPEYIRYQESIYESTVMNIMMLVNALEEQVESCLLIGHNPALTGLINALNHFSLDNLPTAGIVGFAFDMRWEAIGAGDGALLFYEYPKKHKR